MNNSADLTTEANANLKVLSGSLVKSLKACEANKHTKKMETPEFEPVYYIPGGMCRQKLGASIFNRINPDLERGTVKQLLEQLSRGGSQDPGAGLRSILNQPAEEGEEGAPNSEF